MALGNGWDTLGDFLALTLQDAHNAAWTFGDSAEIGLYGSLGLLLRRSPFPYGATDGDTLGEWACNEGSGATIADRLALKNMTIATSHGAENWLKLGLDGTAAFVPAGSRLAATAASFNWGVGGSYTADVIVWIDASTTVATNYFTPFASRDGANLIDIRINGSSNDWLGIVVGSLGTATAGVGITIVQGYHHIRVTISGDHVILYQDGVLIEDETSDHGFTGAAAAVIRLGGSSAATPVYCAGGKIMSARASKVVRSDTPQLFSTSAISAVSPTANASDYGAMRRGIRRIHVFTMGSGGQIAVRPVVDGNLKASLGNITAAGLASFSYGGLVETPKTSLALRFETQADSGATTPPLRVVGVVVEPMDANLTPAVLGAAIGSIR